MAAQGRRRVPSRSRSGQDDLADHFADAVVQSETFCINAHGVAKYLLSRAVRDAGYKVVITGEGSDEILGGYAHFRRDMLLYNREGQDPADVAALLQRSGSRPTRSRAACSCRMATSKPLDHVKRVLGFVPVVDRDVLRALGQDATTCARRDFLRRRSGSRATLSPAAERSRRPRAAERPGSGASVALPVVEDAAARPTS